MNSESEDPKTSSRLWVRTASVHTQANNRRGRLPNGSLCLPVAVMIQRVGAVDALELKPVAGVAAGQGTQRQQSCHKAHVGVGFAGLYEPVHLIEAGEVVHLLWRGLESFFHLPIQGR